jgi:hypothetical protein
MTGSAKGPSWRFYGRCSRTNLRDSSRSFKAEELPDSLSGYWREHDREATDEVEAEGGDHAVRLAMT